MDLYHVGAITPEKLTEARIWLEAIIVRQACAVATARDIEALNESIRTAEMANREGDFDARAAAHVDFHRILARISANPIIMIVMDGVLNVLTHYIQTIGRHEDAFVLPSRRRFMKHPVARDADAAVAEMEASLKRLQRNYLSHAAEKSSAGTR